MKIPSLAHQNGVSTPKSPHPWFCFTAALFISLLVLYVAAKPSQLVLFTEDGSKFEITSRSCKAGVFIPDDIPITCACVSGIWGFYKKFCKKPDLVLGGASPGACFRLDEQVPRLTQAIPFGYVRYPDRPSITHFREDFKIMTKSFYTDVSELEFDIPAVFITITGTNWTIVGDTGDELCLQSGFPEVKEDVFCLFQVTKSEVDHWTFITGISRGCHGNVVLGPENCYPVMPANDECNTEPPDPIVPGPSEMSTVPPTPIVLTTTPSWTENYTTWMPPTLPSIPMTTPLANASTEMTPILTTEPASTEPTTAELTTGMPTTTELIITSTTEKTSETCSNDTGGIEREFVKRYWSTDHADGCSQVFTKVLLEDSLKRFATYKMHSLMKSRQNSLHQMEEIFKLHAELIKTTCSANALPHEFVDAMTWAFTWLIQDDFFYGVEEFEASLFERVVFALKTCIAHARTFRFLEVDGPCNSTILLPVVYLDGQELPVTLPEMERWRNYEPLIESGWKMFLNAHSYCYKYFYRQNDHHSYSLKLLEIFSTTIYEKWKQPLSSPELYKFIVPNYSLMDRTLDSQDLCVAAVAFVSTCPVWMARSSTRDMGLGKRKRRSIWIKHYSKNREDRVMWGGQGFCLRSPDDPSYHLGFGRCAHP